MKNRSTRNICIILLALVALAVSLRSWTEARAQLGDGSVKVLHDSILSLAPGQKLRVSVANTAPSRSGSGSYELFIYRFSGAALFESKGVLVPTGEFRSTDIHREELDVEAGTPVWVRVVIHTPAGSEPTDFPGSLAIIDEVSGITDLYLIIEGVRGEIRPVQP